MVSLRQRSVIFFTFLLACLGLALLAGGLGTRYWIVAQATNDKLTNGKTAGFIHFGLFQGIRRLNHGFGERIKPLNIAEIVYQYNFVGDGPDRDSEFMVKDLYYATIVCICASMLFAIVAAISAVVNTASTPSEPVCHFPGMIAWNVIAALFAFGSLLTWIVQYFVKLRRNVLWFGPEELIREDQTTGGWSTDGNANIGHSFWLVVVAFAIFCFNVTILHFLQKRRNKSQSSKRAIVEATTKPNGNLMLY